MKTQNKPAPSEAGTLNTLAKSQNNELSPKDQAAPNHSHAWRGTWDRPMKSDENEMHPFTVARMTDHNVRATDNEDDE